MNHRPRPRSGALIWFAFSAAVTMVTAVACSHGWDSYDPRLGSGSASSAGGGSAQSSTAAESASSTTAASSSASTSVASSSASTTASSSASSGAGGGDAGPPTYRDIILADGPLAYWRLGDTQGPTIVDEVGPHPGVTTASGLTYGVPGLLAGNTAIAFNGVNGSIGVPGAWDFVGETPYSIEVWAKLAPSTNDYPRIISKEENSKPREGYILLAGAPTDAGSPFFGGERWSNDKNILAAYFHGPIASMEWTHVVYRFNGSQGAVFINGSLADTGGTSTDAGLVAVPNEFTIGSTDGQGSHFAGTLDEIAVYGKALSNSTIVNHYNAGLAGQ